MFSSTQYLGQQRLQATAYREIGATTALDGASPHKLVSLLYAALESHIATARGALARRDIPAKAHAISRAVRIIEEGLRMPLNMEEGGAIASNLHDLYVYMVHKLTLANLKSDDAALAECASLVGTLREGWDGIADRVATDQKVAA